MRKDSLGAGKQTRQAMMERLADYLRRAHPGKTAEAVEASTHGAVAAARVRKWLALAAAPDLYAFTILVRVYGAEFLVDVMGDAPVSLLDAAMAEHREKLEAQRRALEEELSSLRR